MAPVPEVHEARVVVAGPDGDRVAVVRARTGSDPPDGDKLARRLGLPSGGGLRVDGRPIGATTPLTDAGLADGSRLEPADRPAGNPHPWTLWLVGGRNTGRSWPVPPGPVLIGPGPAADIELDISAGTPPATVHVGPDGSVIVVDRDGARPAAVGEPVRAVERLLIVTARPGPLARPRSGTTIPVRPTVTPVEGPTAPPDPPAPAGAPPEPPPFGWISALTPLAGGAVVALLWSPRFAVFAALGPAIAVGGWLEQRRRHRRSLAEHRSHARREEAEYRRALDHQAGIEAARARRHLPAFPEQAERARVGGPGLWTAEPRGLASVGWDGVHPVAVSLLGATTAIRGPEPMATGVAAHLIVQLATSHPPTDLHIVGSGGGGRLSWIGWLPHRVPVAGSDPIRMRVIDGRALPVQPPGAREAHLLVLAGGEEPPPWVDTTVVVATDGTGVIERRTGATEPGGPRTVMAAPLRAVDAARAARHLARWRPVAHDDPVRQPGAVIGLDQLIGPLDHVGALLDRWALDPEAGGIGGLGAPVGMQASGPFTIDLVRDGPHAVIGGTTGSGKSELLRTLVASICAGHPPESVIFVLVDYKGGSAFDGCAGLPHVTTVVTDLDGSRTARVLTAVDAELTRRERWLRQHHRSDLDGAAGLAGRPPRLVVAIDEFATLARDQPDFLPALVDVARRGRSLGLHLVLATQRPAGAMTDDMRANIDLRIALRMVDATDSTDVIGAADAARIPADRPGQAAMRRGGGPVEGFQAATATSGPSSDHEAALDVRWIPDPGADPRPGPPAAASPSPLQRLESTARAAMARSGRSPARPIWPPELPTELSPLDLDEDVPGGERGRLGRRHRAGDPDTDAPAWATVGWADDLTAIRHQPCDWAPARGALALSGTHGSDMAGVITGVVAAVHRQLGPCHVYAADGTGELDGWAGSDPVAAVVRAEARDGMRRLVDRLERELRRRDRKPGLHLVLLAVHHHPAVAGALDDLDGLRLLDRLHRIVAEGPEHGIASIVSTPRPGVLPTVLGGAAARRLVLHLADADDYRLVGLRPPTSPLAPGRALDERGMDVQLARLEPAHLAPVTTAATIDRPRRLAPLPTVVPARPGPTDSGRDPWLLPVGVDHDGPVAIALSRGSATVVAGPPGSGRTTALQTIATGAEQRGTQVLTVHPADGLAEGPRADTVDELGRLLAVISGRRRDSGEPAAERSSARPGPARRLLIVIDDATELEDPDGTLAAMVRGRLRPAAVRLVLAVDPLDARAAYGHWTASVRRGRCGIALHHDPDEDRDLWALPLPPAPTERRPPGRGLLLRDGEDAVEIQVARP